MTKQEVLEEGILLAMDTIKQQATEQTTKIIADLFKSLVLKKYKDAFDQELAQGVVHKKNIDKAVDFCYSDVCVAIRQMSGWSDDAKEHMIQEGKLMRHLIIEKVEQILINGGVKIIP